ncbi:TRAP transporter solute receptor TAXI family precursor, partial [Reticulomyxa filosa]
GIEMKGILKLSVVLFVLGIVSAASAQQQLNRDLTGNAALLPEEKTVVKISASVNDPTTKSSSNQKKVVNVVTTNNPSVGSNTKAQNSSEDKAGNSTKSSDTAGTTKSSSTLDSMKFITTPTKESEKPKISSQEKKKQFDLISKTVIPKPYIDDNYITVGTGSITGVYYPAGGAICRMINREKDQLKIKCGVESTLGSVYNLTALRNAELDFGIVQSDWQEHAFDGTDIFKEDGSFEKLRFIFSLHNEAFTMIVKKNSGINKLDDIQNKV